MFFGQCAVKDTILNSIKRLLCSITGQWWLVEVEKDFKLTKEKFFANLSSDTPQKCLEILADFEAHYNETMWTELEKEINQMAPNESKDIDNALVSQLDSIYEVSFLSYCMYEYLPVCMYSY